MTANSQHRFAMSDSHSLEAYNFFVRNKSEGIPDDIFCLEELCVQLFTQNPNSDIFTLMR